MATRPCVPMLAIPFLGRYTLIREENQEKQ